MPTHDITVQHSDTGLRSTARIVLTRDGNGPERSLQPPPPGTSYELRFHGDPLGEDRIVAASPWDAVTLLRERLEASGWRPLIAAADPRRYPINLRRNFETTQVALLEPPAGCQRWTSFWTPIDEDQASTVTEQQQRYATWLQRYDSNPAD